MYMFPRPAQPFESIISLSLCVCVVFLFSSLSFGLEAGGNFAGCGHQEHSIDDVCQGDHGHRLVFGTDHIDPVHALLCKLIDHISLFTATN